MVADKLPILTNYYSMIETGDRQQDMNISILTGLSKVFDMPVEELIRLETEYVNNLKERKNA